MLLSQVDVLDMYKYYLLYISNTSTCDSSRIQLKTVLITLSSNMIKIVLMSGHGENSQGIYVHCLQLTSDKNSIMGFKAVYYKVIRNDLPNTKLDIKLFYGSVSF